MGRHGGLQHGPIHDDVDEDDDAIALAGSARDATSGTRRVGLLGRARRIDDHVGHGHAHGPAAPATTRSRIVLAALLGPILVVAVIGVVLLWPQADRMPDTLPYVSPGASVTTVVASAVPDTNTMLVDATLDGQTVKVTVEPQMLDQIEPGDTLRVLVVEAAAGTYGSQYVFVDFDRTVPLWVLVILYVLVVALVARWRGLAAVVGLVAAGAMILFFTLPALLTGQPGLAVALVTAAVVMFIVLYLAHGFTARTSTALLGTLAGLGLTAGIGFVATQAAQMTGTGTDDAYQLFVRADLDLRQVFLCGLVLAGMGVLNDVTITQASAVWELRAVSPHATRRELFARAMRIGRDHIASTVYTIAFAYVGAALPVLMLMAITEAPGDVRWTTGQVAEEIVRTLVGSIGLVLAIPITTAIAALVVPSPDELDEAREEAAAFANGEPGDRDEARVPIPDPQAERAVRRSR